MHVSALWLTDFRCYDEAELVFSPGVTVISGANAQGKTTLLEAVAWARDGKSFRGVPDAALVRDGARAGDPARRGRRRRPHAAARSGAPRAGSQPRAAQPAERHPHARPARAAAGLDLRARRPAAGEGRAGDAARLPRRAARDERAALDAICNDYDRVLRQRNALLRGGLRGDDDATRPSSVFDAQLARRGSRARRAAGCGCSSGWFPRCGAPTPSSRGRPRRSTRRTSRAWAEVELTPDDDIEGRAAGRARGPAQGRDRPGRHAGRPPPRRVAAAHRRPGEPHARLPGGAAHPGPGPAAGRPPAVGRAHRARAPVLLLDDVFSELDEYRSTALTTHLSTGQTLITTAGARARTACRPTACSTSRPGASPRPHDRARAAR